MYRPTPHFPMVYTFLLLQQGLGNPEPGNPEPGNPEPGNPEPGIPDPRVIRTVLGQI